MKNFEPKDGIAGLVIVAMIIFKLTGHNGTLDTTVALIIGYYFARRQDTQITIPPEIVDMGTHKVLTTPVQTSNVKDTK